MRHLVAIALVGVILAGCGADGGPGENRHGRDMDEQRQTLMQRPSMEEATARYERMLGSIRDRLAEDFPWIRWERKLDSSRSMCGDFPDLSDAESSRLGVWSAEGNLPDVEWPRAERIVAEVTAEYGFGGPETVVSRESDHQVVGSDRYGASYRFGTAKRTVLSGSTGCHLLQAAKDAPPPATE